MAVRKLENDARNPCVGCGPENPVGLHLAFEDDGVQVRTPFVAEPSREGWPGRLHSGVLYLAMLETANWTVYGRLGRVGLPVRTSALTARRWVATGETLTLSGRVVSPAEKGLVVGVAATAADGTEVATLERGYALPPRAEFLAKMGYDAVPPGLEDVLPE